MPYFLLPAKRQTPLICIIMCYCYSLEHFYYEMEMLSRGSSCLSHILDIYINKKFIFLTLQIIWKEPRSVLAMKSEAAFSVGLRYITR